MITLERYKQVQREVATEIWVNRMDVTTRRIYCDLYDVPYNPYTLPDSQALIDDLCLDEEDPYCEKHCPFRIKSDEQYELGRKAGWMACSEAIYNGEEF